MNSVFNKVIIVLFLGLLNSGCVKELTPENNGYKAKPVIWAILNPDSTVTLVSSGNKGIEDMDQVNLSGIDMFLYENEIQVDQLFSQTIKSENQLHKFQVKPKHFNFYTLRLMSQTIDLTGSVQVPNLLPKPEEINLTQGDNAQLSYSLKDDVVFNDAYQFSVEMFHYGVLTDTLTDDTINKNYLFTSFYDKFDEPTLNFDFLGLNNSGTSEYTFPVGDNLFNGKKKTFLFTLKNPASNLYFIPRTASGNTQISDLLDSRKQYLLIRCRKISPGYYKFIVSENKNNSIFGTSYFNPTNVYSNITGGLGLMGAITERTDTVWIRK